MKPNETVYSETDRILQRDGKEWYFTTNYWRKLFTSLCEKVGEIDEGKFIYEQIRIGGVINEYDARGELGELIQCSLQVQDNRHRLAPSIISLLQNYVAQYSGVKMIDRKLFIQLLGLRAYATKADIMKELDELL